MALGWLVGHFVGDYVLQTDWMATRKKERTAEGELACLLHCGLWTLAVVALAGWWQWQLVVVVFLSHYVLDRTTLVRMVSMATGSACIASGLADGSPLAISLGVFVEIMKDNAAHLLFLWAIATWIVPALV